MKTVYTEIRKNMADFEKKNEVSLGDGHRLPEVKTLLHVSKLSIVEDRAIMMDYWTDSIDKKVMIGIKADGKKMLIKNTEEYTSYIEKVFRISNKETEMNDYIIMTENSIYLVDADIPSKKVSFDE